MTGVLERICADKRRAIATRRRERPFAVVITEAAAVEPPRGFLDSLRRVRCDRRFGLIAEIKRASPSRGVIRDDVDPAGLARAYRDGGATCLSVLTDEPYFGGRDEDLSQARAAVDLPVLRKDFMLEDYQVIESRALGADAILLILAALSDEQARELAAAAREFAMDCLVEVHDAAELERALSLGSPLIGINNRNLRTLSVDLAVTERLAPLVPSAHLLVAESGLRDSADLERLAAAGASTFLVGESLMVQADVAAATRALLAGPYAPAP